MVEARLRTRIGKEELDAKVGKILTPGDHNLRLTGPTRVRMPDGRLLCVYLPGALKEACAAAYDELTKIRLGTENRGLAAGAIRVKTGRRGRTRGKPVYSGILGAFDPVGGGKDYCRLTAFTAQNLPAWEALHPFLQAVAGEFDHYVHDRYLAQMAYVNETAPDWVVPDTPFTTITVNNTYSTGVHTDKGDLDEGFSCLAVLRRGDWSGGILTFPEYRVGVDMQDGDLILMDAHQWHGNTGITCKCGNTLSLGPCKACGAERISVVCYYRTKMRECGSAQEEESKWQAHVEKKALAAEA